MNARILTHVQHNRRAINLPVPSSLPPCLMFVNSCSELLYFDPQPHLLQSVIINDQYMKVMAESGAENKMFSGLVSHGHHCTNLILTAYCV